MDPGCHWQLARFALFPPHGLSESRRGLRSKRTLPQGAQTSDADFVRFLHHALGSRSAGHPDGAATAPVGVGGDADFVGGGDHVVYQIPVPEAEKTVTVDVELLYQPLSARYAAELFLADVRLVRRFRAFYEAADRPPELVARARLVAGPQ